MPHWNKIVIHDSVDNAGQVHTSDDIIAFHRSWKNLKTGETLTEDEALALISEGQSGISRPWKEGGDHWHLEFNHYGYAVDVKMIRPMTSNGAHAREGNLNKNSIGIRLIGDFTDTPPEPEMLDRLLVLVRFLMKTYKISVDSILAHHEVSREKDCPGAGFDVAAFRDLVRQSLAENQQG